MNRKELDELYADKDRDGLPDRIDNSYSDPRDEDDPVPPASMDEDAFMEMLNEMEQREREQDPLEKMTAYKSNNIEGLEIRMYGDGSGGAYLNNKQFADINLFSGEIQFENTGYDRYDLGQGGKISEVTQRAMVYIEDYAVRKLDAKEIPRYAIVTPAFCEYLQRQDFSFSKCKLLSEREQIISYAPREHCRFESHQAAYQRTMQKGRSL